MSDEQFDLLDRPVTPPSGYTHGIPPPWGDAVEARSVQPVLLTRADPSRNMHRFYGLELATSLFGECGVVRYWGRIGASGRSRTDWFEKPQEAEAAFLTLLKAKRRRGYAPSYG